MFGQNAVAKWLEARAGTLAQSSATALHTEQQDKKKKKKEPKLSHTLKPKSSSAEGKKVYTSKGNGVYNLGAVLLCL